jgi:glycosyltransferase involved in cell wall biosynthesis
MIVGIVRDRVRVSGGAELSLDTLLDAAPDDVEIRDFNDGSRETGITSDGKPDVWVVGNCTQFSADELVPFLARAPVVKRVADYWENGDMVLRDWLLTNSAKLIFSSPGHLADFPHTVKATTVVIPPPVDIAPFVAAREAMTGKRKGTCWIGHMKNPHQKGVLAAVRWAQRWEEPTDFYGENAPELVGSGDYVTSHQQLPYAVVPQFMARYERFLFLPQYREPFGRTIIEALAAGCKIVTNAVPGCIWYLETDMPQMIENASANFWQMVTEAAHELPDTSRVTAI